MVPNHRIKKKNWSIHVGPKRGKRWFVWGGGLIGVHIRSVGWFDWKEGFTPRVHDNLDNLGHTDHHLDDLDYHLDDLDYHLDDLDHHLDDLDDLDHLEHLQ